MRNKIPIVTLRCKLLRAVIALTVALAAAATAHAWTITATGEIVGNSGRDGFGLFGGSGSFGSLVGPYTLTITTDPYLNGGQGLDTVTISGVGGSGLPVPVTGAPFTVTVTVNGVSYTQTELNPFINAAYLYSFIQAHQDVRSAGCVAVVQACTESFINAISATPFIPLLDFNQSLTVTSDVLGGPLNESSRTRFYYRDVGGSNASTEFYGGITTLSINSIPPSDTTPPVLTLPGNITRDATSPQGTIVTYAVTATDNSGVAPTVSCIPKSGLTFAIGTTTVSCTATDAANNSATGSFTVTVIGAVEQLENLIFLVGTFDSPFGLTNRLENKLEHAIDALEAMKKNSVGRACNKLDAFIDVARSQSGNKLTVGQAHQLIASAKQIRAVVGCR